jgi:hypothetical protein
MFAIPLIVPRHSNDSQRAKGHHNPKGIRFYWHPISQTAVLRISGSYLIIVKSSSRSQISVSEYGLKRFVLFFLILATGGVSQFISEFVSDELLALFFVPQL